MGYTSWYFFTSFTVLNPHQTYSVFLFNFLFFWRREGMLGGSSNILDCSAKLQFIPCKAETCLKQIDNLILQQRWCFFKKNQQNPKTFAINSLLYFHRYPNYEFISDNSISWSAGLHNRYTENSLRGVILDIHFLSQADFLVCTFSSQVNSNTNTM